MKSRFTSFTFHWGIAVIASLVLVSQAQRSFAEEADFGYGYDAGDTPETAVWVYPTEIYEGIGNIDDDDDYYSIEIQSSSEPVIIYLSTEEPNFVYATIKDESGQQIGSTIILDGTSIPYDGRTIQYQPTQVYTIHVWSGTTTTYSLSFSGWPQD